MTYKEREWRLISPSFLGEPLYLCTNEKLKGLSFCPLCVFFHSIKIAANLQLHFPFQRACFPRKKETLPPLWRSREVIWGSFFTYEQAISDSTRWGSLRYSRNLGQASLLGRKRIPNEALEWGIDGVSGVYEGDRQVEGVFEVWTVSLAASFFSLFSTSFRSSRG